MKRKAGKKITVRRKPNLVKAVVEKGPGISSTAKTHLPTKLVSLMPTYGPDEQLWKSHPYGGRYNINGGTKDVWFTFLNQIHNNGIDTPIKIRRAGHKFKRNYTKWNPGYGVTSGNHRRFAALELGMRKVPVTFNYFGKNIPKPSELSNMFKFSIRRVKGI